MITHRWIEPMLIKLRLNAPRLSPSPLGLRLLRPADLDSGNEGA